MQNEDNSELTNGRLGWDSDPRNPARSSPAFGTGGINHYPTSPLLDFSLTALPIPGATEIRFDGSDYSPAQDECWLPVVGFEGWYEVSNQGRVRRIMPGPKAIPGRILKTSLQRQGYIFVSLSRHSKETKTLMHLLVAAAFLGPCPGGFEINHKDGNKANNRLSNLEYVTHSENLLHAFRTGLAKPMQGESHHQAKLTAEDVRKIRSLRKVGVYQRDIAKVFGVSHALIAWIDSGKIWRHIE